MTNRLLFTASFSLVLALGTGAFGQSTEVGPAPGVPAPAAQSGSTNPDREAPKRSERETRDQEGAERATGDQLGTPSGLAPSEDQVRRMLDKQGYSDVHDLRQQGDSYTGRATKDGKSVQLRIDPQRGKIDEIGG
jgi:hypothetical protein